MSTKQSTFDRYIADITRGDTPRPEDKGELEDRAAALHNHYPMKIDNLNAELKSVKTRLDATRLALEARTEAIIQAVVMAKTPEGKPVYSNESLRSIETKKRIKDDPQCAVELAEIEALEEAAQLQRHPPRSRPKRLQRLEDHVHRRARHPTDRLIHSQPETLKPETGRLCQYPSTATPTLPMLWLFAFPNILLQDPDNSATLVPYAPKARDFHKPLWDQLLWLTNQLANQNKLVYKPANYSILAADSGIQFSVSGGGTVTLTVPTGIALPANGVPQRNRFFVPRDGSTLVVKAPGTDIIEFGALATAAGGNLTSNVYGCAFELVNTEANRWLAIALTPTMPTVN